MKRVVLNLCGVKSKGGITVLNNYLSQNKDKTFYILYDNLNFEQYIKNFDIEYINVKRRYHPILNLILQKDIIKKINTFDYVIHFGNFGFKTKIKSYTLIQNILPLVKPYSSVRNFLLNFLYKLSFKISDEIIVQQRHVFDLIPSKYKTRIIGFIKTKSIKQSINDGFVTIYEENKNKNPKFQLELLEEISSKFEQKITVINLSLNKQNNSFNDKFTILNNLDRDEVLKVFKRNSVYIHTSEFETVGLPIYEALGLGLKVVTPNLEYMNLTNENIFKYEFGNYSSAINACNESIKKTGSLYLDVPIYSEDWKLD